jgi:hypothetical protein
MLALCCPFSTACAGFSREQHGEYYPQLPIFLRQSTHKKSPFSTGVDNLSHCQFTGALQQTKVKRGSMAQAKMKLRNSQKTCVLPDIAKVATGDQPNQGMKSMARSAHHSHF